MLQDSGEHLGFFTLDQREPFFAAFAKACRQAGTRFWVNVETGEEDVNDWGEYFTNIQRRQKSWDYWRFTPIEWLEKKLCLAASYAENIVNWGYYPFMTPNPLPGQELLAKQAAYEAYTEQYLGTPDRVKAQTEVRSNAVHYSYTALDRLTLAGYSIDDSNETFTIVEGPQC